MEIFRQNQKREVILYTDLLLIYKININNILIVAFLK